MVDRLEVCEGLDGDLRSDLVAGGKVESLDGVLTVADVRADDAEGLEDRPEHVRLRKASSATVAGPCSVQQDGRGGRKEQKETHLDVGVGRKTDGDEGSVRAEVLESVVVGSSTSRGDDSSLRRERRQSEEVRREEKMEKRAYMRSDTAANALDLLNEGAGSTVLLEVHKNITSIRLNKLLLLGSGVESDDAKTDRLSVLDGQVTDCERGERTSVRC